MIHHFVLAAPLGAVIPLLSAIGGIASAGASVLTGMHKPKPPPVPNTPPVPTPEQQPQGSQAPTNAPSGTPSFLAAATTPAPQNVPGKTLLGQ